MKLELIKQTFKLGNSAGVLLPIEWKDKKVKVQLIDKSINQDILDILGERDLLKNAIGIFLVGSYARGEATPSSDVDVLVITEGIDKQLKVREYEILLISQDRLIREIKNSLYLVSMLNEAKAIINRPLIEMYKTYSLDFKIEKHLKSIKSMIKINETSVDISTQNKEDVSDETMYSIILRLRETYLIDCLKSKKMPSNKEFLGIIRKISGSYESYEAYLRIKNDKPSKKVIKISDATMLINYTKSKVNSLEHGKKK